ncbi:hypothetical protein TEA_023935 [Camellia sinensis var. sinensis]|uniref:Xyloglucan endotransglucosylase/hydrolase n=1 Tax=Camellia sinensis var. sinensis TaxID=542762 RepID=A0A4S4CZJ9_CAMSN|nr:hypothetical protein TEA_023935 [Camellia sinensis var. sinensis]
MAICISCKISMMLLVFLFVSSFMAASASNFYDDFDLTWGNQRARIRNGGQLLTLSLDKASGSGFQSKREYLFGRIDMQLKLVSGNSAGTVTAYYLSSQGPTHDEIDFEFLGNISGQPYIVHTNVFTQGKGNREQQFYLWFDPTRNFHTYSIVWNPQNIIFFVDNKPIRVFKNEEATTGVPNPKNQPMRIYSSLWNADDWATQGGLVKTDWSKAPFTAFYRNFNANACVPSSSSSSPCSSMTTSSVLSGAEWQTQGLDAAGRRRLRWVQKYYMVYNYCSDLKRFPQGLPPDYGGASNLSSVYSSRSVGDSFLSADSSLRGSSRYVGGADLLGGSASMLFSQSDALRFSASDYSAARVSTSASSHSRHHPSSTRTLHQATTTAITHIHYTQHIHNQHKSYPH